MRREDMKECPSYKRNLEMCTCTYAGCPKKGKCCECMHYHRMSGELPACFFPAEVEKTYDRSIRKFVQINR
jgi:hypothetical protein